MLTIIYDSYCVLNKVYGEGAYLKQAMLSVPIEERNRSAVTKICYGVLERDILLSYYIDRLCEKTPKSAVRTILKISMYCLRFLRKAPYAVTDAAVEMCTKLGKGGVSGFVNAVLRKFINGEFPLPEEEITNLSLTYDFPEFAVKRLIADYGKERAINVMKAPAEPTCLRFNGANGREYLEKLGINYSETPFENVFFAEKFTRNADYDDGVYTFQSIGSVAVCDAVSAGKNLFDACAAPGGKAVLLAGRFESVTANELHPHRAELIRGYAARMRAENVIVETGDASVFRPEKEGAYDAVLCDVPCSGFGVIKENPDIKLKKTDDTVKELSAVQLKILSVCASYVKNGGSLYYSTCTYFKEECDGVIYKFLSENKAFTPRVISNKIPCIKTDFGIQYLPDESFGAGFYICAMERKN
ncbi:MAG: hypothetical protein J6Z34_02925 [Clostridia bacterium]|nr:hypothetical protein [Clostridia bacterium]